MSHQKNISIFLGALVVLLFFSDILFGPIKLSFGEILGFIFNSRSVDASKYVIIEIRTSKAITAAAAGMGLSLCGLLLQTLFRNPLAGPYTLGITSGASLGAAIAMMAGVYISNKYLHELNLLVCAGIGSFLVLVLIMLVSTRVHNITMLLIIGLLLGHVFGAAESLLQYFARPEQVQSFAIWGMGSFSHTSVYQSIFILLIVFIAYMITQFLSKPLNTLILGDDQAALIGTNTRSLNRIIIFAVGVIATVVTAFCGPIAFVGFIAPHIARWLTNTHDHKILGRTSFTIGAIITLACDIISQNISDTFIIPVNIIASIIGAPLIIWVIVKRISI